MLVEIEIIDRVYYNILDFCQAKCVDALEYMSDAIVDRYNLDKYGDLNKKIKQKQKTYTIEAKEEKKEPIMIGQDTKKETVKEEKKSEMIEKPNIVTNEIEEGEKETKRRTRRTLKSK